MAFTKPLASLLMLMTLSACSGLFPVEEQAPVPVSDNPAVVALVDSARAQLGANKGDAAAAGLERALRIEPQNPRLWQELARLRLEQGQVEQAASLAAKSNSYAGTDKYLRAANWRLISEARALQGDTLAAQQALERAERELR